MITAFQKNAFQLHAFQIDVTARVVVGSVSSGPPSKRWWEELLEEYRAKYPREPSRAKRAVVARRQVEERVEEAILAGLLTEFKTEVVEVAVKAMTAPRVKEALEYSAKAQALLDRMDEEDDEETILLLM